MNFLGGATSRDSVLKAYKTSKTKGFFPYESFDCPQKINNNGLPPYDAIFSKVRNVNLLEKYYSDYQKSLSCGWKTEEALSKMKLSKPPPSVEKTTNICLIYEIMRLCVHLKTFYAGKTTKALSQHSKQCKNACFLSQERNLLVEARVYTSKFGKYLFPQIYQR